MNHLFLTVAAGCALLAVPIAAGGGDDRPLPRPGLWQESGTATHYDRAGRPVAMEGSTVRRRSERYCMTAQASADFYANPLPTCRFDLRREGADTYRAIAVCPASGMRFDVLRHVTPNAMDTRSVQTGSDGTRVESTSRSVRIGECPSAVAQAARDADGPQPIAPPATWFSADDYPAAALRAHAGGRVGWEVDVDGGGMITACRIVASSGNAALDTVTCAILSQRGRFEPDRPGAYGNHTSWVAPPR